LRRKKLEKCPKKLTEVREVVVTLGEERRPEDDDEK